MHNKTYPKSSITEGYIVEECLAFYSRYFKSVETAFNWPVRNVEESMGAVVSITLDSNSCIQAHRYVPIVKNHPISRVSSMSLHIRFSDPDRSLNRKIKRFKVFEVELKSNRDDIIINLIIN